MRAGGLSWGFWYEEGIMRDLSGLFPLRSLFLRPKQKASSGSGELNKSWKGPSTLPWAVILPLKGMFENSKIRCFKYQQHPTCRSSPATFSDILALWDIENISSDFIHFPNADPFGTTLSELFLVACSLLNWYIPSESLYTTEEAGVRK